MNLRAVRAIYAFEMARIQTDRAADGDTDSAAEVAHHIEQAAGIFQPLGRKAAEAEIDAGRNGEHLREATKDLRPE